ncbi:MAG: transcriptional regulator GcvA [Gammaproteobacteria bacterium]|nr:transcriptional regulator GcvA [Gammaproteobacteria bacterium]
MAKRLPPLNALRAFEAAARHLSFTRAAEELHVTQAAISHQVKALEEHLGRKLFKRLNRALLLSDDGQAYLPSVSRAFTLLNEATDNLVSKQAPGPLTVSALPSFAARWLVPRLGRFRQIRPDIDLRIDPSAELTDFAGGDVDVSIRYGRGKYPGLRADWLMTEDIFPVCSPALLEGPHPLRDPQDLEHQVLLHDDGHGDWRTWLLAAGVERVDPTRGPIFTDSGMVIQASMAGQGVALARAVLAADELAAGRLVRPFTLSLPSEYAYYLVCPANTAEHPKIAAFRDWLLSEARGEASPA